MALNVLPVESGIKVKTLIAGNYLAKPSGANLLQCAVDTGRQSN